MIKPLGTADQLLQALQQEKELFDKNLQDYQRHLKAQLLSPAMLSAAVALGIGLAFYYFPKKAKTSDESDSLTAPVSSSAHPSFATQMLRDVSVAVVVPFITKWLMQKTD